MARYDCGIGKDRMNMKTLMEQLKGLREDNDLTQAQIAELLGTSQTMYARYERGANELPIRHLVTLCKFYNVSADELLDTVLEAQRKDFLENELPQILKRMKLLGLDSSLLKI